MLVKPPKEGKEVKTEPQVQADLGSVIKTEKASWVAKNPSTSSDSDNDEVYQTPKLVEVEDTTEYRKDDPPLINIKVTNPVTYLKMWLKRLLRNEGIDLRLRIRPLTAIAIGLSFATFFAGTGFSVAKVFFPNSSPILKRGVAFQGTVQKSEKGDYYLILTDGAMYRLAPKSRLNLTDYISKYVSVKGNLGREPNVITVSEIVSFDAK